MGVPILQNMEGPSCSAKGARLVSENRERYKYGGNSSFLYFLQLFSCPVFLAVLSPLWDTNLSLEPYLAPSSSFPVSLQPPPGNSPTFFSTFSLCAGDHPVAEGWACAEAAAGRVAVPAAAARAGTPPAGGAASTHRPHPLPPTHPLSHRHDGVSAAGRRRRTQSWGGSR